MYATCHITGCGNEGIPIPIAEVPGTVVCGPCGQPITDLTTTPPALPEEIPSWLD